MFFEHAPIQNLSTLFFDGAEMSAVSANEIISSIAIKCPRLKNITLAAHFDSWESIHTVVEYCRDLEQFDLHNYSPSELKRPEFVLISSLPLLESLDFKNCQIEDGAIIPLARCEGLRDLCGYNLKFPSDLMLEIGGNLRELACISPDIVDGVLEGIIEHCPNLESLNITVGEYDYEEDEENCETRVAEGLLCKRGLKKLGKLVISGMTIRLGTDWEGEED
jgi:hypothetical protein